VEELAVHVYGDAGWRSVAHIRQAIGLMTLPEGWALRLGPAGVEKLVRCLPPEIFKARGRLRRNRISKKTLLGIRRHHLIRRGVFVVFKGNTGHP
jgi:hypothetical protein